jgi:hypothetical protein
MRANSTRAAVRRVVRLYEGLGYRTDELILMGQWL